MSQFQQFDISDFLNELKEPIFLMDEDEIIFFNRNFVDHLFPVVDDWRQFFDNKEIILELEAFFQNGSVPNSRNPLRHLLVDGTPATVEWEFVKLPSSYTSRFLAAKGSRIIVDPIQPMEVDPTVNKLGFLQSVLNHSHDLIAILDADGTYKFVSDSITEKLGYSLSDFIGKNYRDFVASGDIEFISGDFAAVLETDEEVSVDFWIKSKDGRRTYQESFARNFLDHPQIQGIMFSSRDVTDLIRIERSLQKRYEIENLIIRVSYHLINGDLLKLESGYLKALSQFGRFLQAAHAEILVFSRESDRLEVITSWISGKELPSQYILSKEELRLIFENQDFLNKGKVRLIRPEFPDQYAIRDLANARILVPMISGAKLLGVVTFQSEAQEFSFEEKELQVLRQLGDVLAGAYQGRQMTQKLKRNESLLAYTEVLSKSGSWRLSVHKKRFFFSGGLTRLFNMGSKPAILDSWAFISKIDKPSRAGFIKDLRQSISDLVRTSGEFTTTDHTGQVRFISYEIEGRREFLTQTLEIYGFCTDISHKRASDSYLRLQSQILAQVGDPILVTNLSFEVIYQNEAAIQLCGEGTANGFEGQLNQLLEIRWEQDESLETIADALNVGDVWKSERQIKFQDKDPSPFEVSIQAIHAEGTDKIGYSVILRGLEEKYRSRQIAKEAKLIVENSPAVLFRVDPNDNFKIHYISENIKRYGYDAAKLIRNRTSILDLLHADDSRMVRERSRETRIAQGVPAFSEEYRLKTAAGEYVWVEDRTRDVVADSGEIVLHEGLFQDISDRKRLELVQNQRDMQYRVLAANIPDTNIFLMDVDRTYILAEGTNFEKWGLMREDFEGKKLKDLQLTPYEEISEIIDRVYDHREIIETEFVYKGRQYHRVMRPIVINDQVKYALSIVRDVQDEYQAKLDLKQSEEKYRRLVEESTEIIFSLTETFAVNYVSPNVKQFLGYDSASVIGCSIFEFLHPDDLGVFQILLDESKDFLAHNQFLEFRLRHINGEYRVFNSNGKLTTDKNGIHRYYTGVARDISKLKETQRELLLAKEKAEQASQIKSQFLSVMSHEIRTPMNAVIGLAHLLMEENPRPDQLENLKTLQFSAENLMALINDILDYNKIDSGKVELEMAPFDLRNVVHRIVHSHTYQAHEKSLKVTCEIDESIPETLIGDSLRMGQIINNLVSNAIKFTEKGFVRIAISREFTHGNKADIRFVFEDTGIGIPEAKRKTIFEAFTQASSSTSRKYGGTGLGLAIVKRLVELFGGEIEVNARRAGGSIFEFTLQFEFVDLQKLEAEKAQLISNRMSLEKASILVAEDNMVNQILIRKFLTKWNTGNLVIASDGREALDCFNSENFDLVLLDLQMPELDGFAVARAIRGHEDLKKQSTPILALTAASFNEVREEMRASGMNDFVPKPFTPESLFEKILKYLNSKDREENGV
jgi:PAS domain S-box-containing protein